MTAEAAWLLAFLLIGHFLGDFTPLSTPSMLRAKAVGTPLGPIGAHAAVHAGLVAVAVALVAGPLVLDGDSFSLGPDIFISGAVDRWRLPDGDSRKVHARRGGR